MALFGLFGKQPLSDKKIDKIAKLAANPYAQPDVRMKEMQKLLAAGSPEALRGLLKRFAANASGAIADEDEKKWLEDALVERGQAAVEPLRQYIKGQEQLTYALRAYRGICGNDEAVRFFSEVLAAYGPDDHRSGEAKLQMVWQLGENLDEPRVLPALIPFLHDHSDDVRWAVLDLLERAADRKLLTDALRQRVCAELGDLVSVDDVGPRIQQRAAEILAAREWQIPGDNENLATLLDETYFLDKKRFVRRRARGKAQGAR